MNIDWRIISALINKARIRTAGYSQSTHRELRTISSDDEATEAFVVLGTAVGEGGIEDIHIDTSDAPRKIMVDNVIYILRGEHIYDIQGMMVR